jgi:hypothetical protein
MKAKLSKILVIDASIARSCGQPEATYPTSVHCREFLEHVLSICHRIVMTPEIRDEWNKHASRFARSWMSQMIARKKLIAMPTLPIDSALWNLLEKLAETDKQRGDIVKDIHLLEAALATDQIIISLDEQTARKYFTQAAQTIETLQPITWVNPDKIEKEQPIAWLLAGCPNEKNRTLGYKE